MAEIKKRRSRSKLREIELAFELLNNALSRQGYEIPDGKLPIRRKAATKKTRAEAELAGAPTGFELVCEPLDDGVTYYCRIE